MKSISSSFRLLVILCLRRLLEANLQLLDLVQREADVSIICALKGFSFWHSFPLIKHYLQGAAASSVNEARLIVEEMVVKLILIRRFTRMRSLSIILSIANFLLSILYINGVDLGIGFWHFLVKKFVAG